MGPILVDMDPVSLSIIFYSLALRIAVMNVPHNTLFTPFRIGRCDLKNRLVALPVFTGYAYPDGRVSRMLTDHYTRLAASGVAMVVVANAAVAPDGMTSTHSLRVDRDDYIDGLAQVARSIKRHGALACLQLNHAGQFAKTDRPLLPAPIEARNLNFRVSALKGFMEFFPLEQRFSLTRSFLQQAGTWRQAMTDDQRKNVIRDFGDAASRAVQAGFDLIELHGANGYLICQFLSAFTNRAQSEFGGDFNRRTLFPVAVVREVKKRVPEGFPVGFRLILNEWVPGGIDPDEAVAFARILKAEGVAYLSASAGTFHSIFRPEILHKMSEPAYLRQDVARLNRDVRLPTIISGRIRTPALADAIIRAKAADLIGLGRPLRADFKWLKKAERPEKKIRTCVNCNWCLKRVVLDQGFNCRRWSQLVQQKTDLNHKLLSRNYNMLYVVTDSHDTDLLKNTLEYLLPANRTLPSPISITGLFVNAPDRTLDQASDQNAFLIWIREMLKQTGRDRSTVNHVNITHQGACDKDIQTIIKKGGYGVIVLGRNPQQTWRERLIYKERSKVLVLLGPGGHQSKILVPLDLSDTSLLVLTFLRDVVLSRSGVKVSVVHLSQHPPKHARLQWHRMKKICGIESNPLPLEVIPPSADIVSDLLNIIRAGRYDTVIMGKRGLSGIKRVLLGSVSAGIVRGLSEESIILID